MKKRQFTTEYKAKIVMEVLREESQISEIVAREGIHRTQLQNWKDEFVKNSAKVFAQNKIERQAKQEALDALEREDELMKKVGQLTIENDWLKKNLPKYSDLIGKQNLVSKDDPLPVKRQCELLSLNRTSVYYKPQEPTAQQIEREELIKSRLDYWA